MNVLIKPTVSRIVVLAGVLLLVAETASGQGTITVTKCWMTDLTNNVQVTWGYADADLPVYFTGAATCTCESPNLTYTWDFDDGDSATGANVSHAFAGKKAGDRHPKLHVHCNSCGANEIGWSLSVHAINGISVVSIGDSSRLCFDSERHVDAFALPLGVDGSELIDWCMPLENVSVSLANTMRGDLPSPSQWPANNSSWGAHTLYVSIDGPFIPGQEGELNLTGPASFIRNNQNVKAFFDTGGTQNPGTGDPKPKNWFFYWTQTSANEGTMHYSSGTASHCAFDPPDYPCYLTDDACSNYTTCDVGANATTDLTGIDTFAYVARHEWRHHNQGLAWWGTDGYDATGDLDGDSIPDLLEECAFPYATGGPFDPSCYQTYPDDRVKNDCERNCVFTQDVWDVGSASKQDWAHPGIQWP